MRNSSKSIIGTKQSIHI